MVNDLLSVILSLSVRTQSVNMAVSTTAPDQTSYIDPGQGSPRLAWRILRCKVQLPILQHLVTFANAGPNKPTASA